eukprot:m.12050 g.12050  ORF g.12050 m.12050 type:complete len:295 (-) comp4577_c0_seq1:22-906(-)
MKQLLRILLACIVILNHKATTGAENVTVGFAQIMCLSSDLDGNHLRIQHAATKAKAMGAEIVVFPETALLGWDNPYAWKAADTIPGRDTDKLAKVAKENNITMIVGMAERVNESTLHDAAVLIDAEGKVRTVHRKINILTELMTPPYQPGRNDSTNIQVTEVSIGNIKIKLGMLICADTFLENVVQAMAELKPDILAIPYGWSGCPANDTDAQECSKALMWPAHGKDLVNLVSGVANKTGAIAIGADSVGQQTVGPWRGQTYGGWSTIASPENILLVGADRDVDIQTVTVALHV